MDHDIFPAGLLGTYYSVRHKHGLYRSCAVTSYYTFTPSTNTNNLNPTPAPLQQLTHHLSRALAKTISRHPSLTYGLLPPTNPRAQAYFKRLSQISWDDIISISTSHSNSHRHLDSAETSDSDTDTDTATIETHLCSEIGSAHEKLFDDPEHKPMWRVRVLMYALPGGRYRVYILFTSHHAIADGLSCAAFQRTLHEELCMATVEGLETREVPWPYHVPRDVGRPIAIEDAMDISPAGSETLGAAVAAGEGEQEKAGGKKVWAGNFPCMPSIESYQSLALLITLPPQGVQRLLETARRLQITVTGYLHGLIVSYLARTTVALTNPQSIIKACTPYSLRKFSNLPMSEMADHISSISTEWDAELLHSMRHTIEQSPEEESLISAIGRKITHELSTEMKTIELAGVPQLRAVANIPDLDSYCRAGLMVEKTATYEISNLGVVRMNQVPEQSLLKLEGLIFSQCGSVLAAPIGCNVANLEGGPLVISLTWQQGGVDHEVMLGLQKFLTRRLGA